MVHFGETGSTSILLGLKNICGGSLGYFGNLDNKQVPWGKGEKIFEKGVKSTWNC